MKALRVLFVRSLPGRLWESYSGVWKTISGVCLLTLATGALTMGQSITNTEHNLSSSGPGTIKATTESRVCIFCHAPHRSTGQAPLWNREDSRSTYLIYDSPTLGFTPGQPTGTSRLCLSCHDGTIALGAVSSETGQIAFQGGIVYLPADHSLLGEDLSDDHPISFVYDEALAASDNEIRSPSALPPTLPLDHDGTMQCSSCHDAHNNDLTKFLRVDPLFSQLCVSCHDKGGWVGSIHESSSQTWSGAGIDPWPHAEGVTVAENGCQNCHQPHEAGDPTHLLAFPEEENNCLVCHNGTVGSDISSAITQASAHPVTMFTDIHSFTEDPLSMPRHVECADCHNPHAANSAPATPPAPDGALALVDGIDLNGIPVDPINSTYEVCFKCHGDNHGASSEVSRMVQNLNTRLDLSPDAVSFHPVTTLGRNSNVPSLIPPLTENSTIGCEDCHSSPVGFPAGTHGSTFSPLLKLNYSTLDNTQESSQAYALCYSCHNRNSILSDQGFRRHSKHIQGEDAPCSACHDSHGIPNGLGNSLNNSHLVNFDISIVFPSQKNGRLEFVDLGDRTGECSLLCHGKDHDRKNYNP